jgi:hypothetical protein
MMHEQERDLLETLMRVEGDKGEVRLEQSWSQSGDGIWACLVRRKKVWFVSSGPTRTAALADAIRNRTEAARRRNEQV